MKVLVVYSRLYAKALSDALGSIRKNAWTLLLPMALLVGSAVVTLILGNLLPGILVGFVVYLVGLAIASTYLYFVSELVAKSRVSVQEFKRAAGAYFFPLMAVGFVLFIGRLLLNLVLQGGRVPNADALMAILSILLMVLLSAAPEVIYQRTPHGGIATIQTSIQFLQQNWLEWIVPNIPLFVVVWGLPRLAGGLPLGIQLVLYALMGALLHVAFVFRGFVFKALDRSSHRQRMFNYRNP